MLIVGTNTKMRKSTHKTRLQDVWFIHVPSTFAWYLARGGQDLIAACSAPTPPDFIVRMELRFPNAPHGTMTEALLNKAFAEFYKRYKTQAVMDKVADKARLWIADDRKRGTLRIPAPGGFEGDTESRSVVEGFLSLHTDGKDGAFYFVWECKVGE